MMAMALLVAACHPVSTEEPMVAPEEVKDEPMPVLVEETLSAAGTSFEARLTLPAEEGAFPLVIVIPGLGSGPAGTPHLGGHAPPAHVHALGFGTLAFAKPGWSAEGAMEDEEAYAAATRATLRELALAAFAWASADTRVAASGHFVATSDLGAVDALVFADTIAAVASLWYQPVVQSHGDYLFDELHRRDWFRRSLRADTDDDDEVTPEEWGLYRGETGHEPGVTFSDIDLDGDGVYTAADNMLAGAGPHAEMLEIIDAGDEAAWRSFWDQRWQQFPSIAWARGEWDAPNLESSLEQGESLVFIVDGDAALAPPIYLEPLLAAGGPERVRHAGHPGRRSHDTLYACLFRFLEPSDEPTAVDCSP